MAVADVQVGRVALGHVGATSRPSAWRLVTAYSRSIGGRPAVRRPSTTWRLAVERHRV